MATYTYEIFDAPPHSSGPCAWGIDGEIDAATDAAAISAVEDALARECAGLSRADGYDVGDTIYTLVENEAGIIVGDPHHTLTPEDLD